MDIYEMKVAVDSAQSDIDRAGTLVNRMAGMCAGRLRLAGVRIDTLNRLKRELRDYNIHTERWKDES